MTFGAILHPRHARTHKHSHHTRRRQNEPKPSHQRRTVERSAARRAPIQPPQSGRPRPTWPQPPVAPPYGRGRCDTRQPIKDQAGPEGWGKLTPYPQLSGARAMRPRPPPTRLGKLRVPQGRDEGTLWGVFGAPKCRLPTYLPNWVQGEARPAGFHSERTLHPGKGSLPTLGSPP